MDLRETNTWVECVAFTRMLTIRHCVSFALRTSNVVLLSVCLSNQLGTIFSFLALKDMSVCLSVAFSATVVSGNYP